MYVLVVYNISCHLTSDFLSELKADLKLSTLFRDVFELHNNEHGVVIHWVALGQNTRSMNHAYHVTVDYINVIITLPLYIKYEEVGGTPDQVCMCVYLMNNWWCESHSMFLSQITAPCWDGDRFCIIDEVTHPDPHFYRHVRWNVSELFVWLWS